MFERLYDESQLIGLSEDDRLKIRVVHIEVGPNHQTLNYEVWLKLMKLSGSCIDGNKFFTDGSNDDYLVTRPVECD